MLVRQLSLPANNLHAPSRSFGPELMQLRASVVRGDNWVLHDVLVRRRQADFAATAQFKARVQRPVRVVQHRSRQEDQRGLTLLQDLLRNLRLGNRADRSGRQFSLFEDALRKRNLIGRAGVIADARRDTAGTAIKQVHAQRPQPFRQFDGLVNVPTAANPIRGRDSHCQRQRFRPDRSNALRRFYRKSNSIFERTAVAIGALVGNRREKTMSQITVGEMQFDQPEPSSQSALGSRHESSQDLFNLFFGQFVRYTPEFVVLATEGNRAWSNGFPSTFLLRQRTTTLPAAHGAALAPGMGQLQSGHRSIGVNELGNAGQHRNVFVRPDPEIPGSNPPARLDGGSFRHHEPGATNGPRTQMSQMPIRRESILCPILAHRRNPDAVTQVDLPQFPRCKKQWFHKLRTPTQFLPLYLGPYLTERYVL